MVKKKRDRTQEQLDQLRQIRTHAADSIPALKEAMGSPSNYVVAKAAEIAEEALLKPLTDDLLAAYQRFMADAPKLDKACAATTAIVKALYALDYQDPAPYRRGIRHHQFEGLGPVDIATELRSVCALGLAQTRDEGVLDELVVLLADAEARARLSAARAIGCRNEVAAIPVLMLKVLLGDAEFEVLAECMAAMLAIATNPRTLRFVVDQLDSADTDRAEAAAIALGSIRDERAFEAIRAKWNVTVTGPIRERLLQAMSMSRTESAIQFLLGLVAEEPVRIAVMATEALAIHRRDSRIEALVAQLAVQRPEIANAIRSAFNRSTLE